VGALKHLYGDGGIPRFYRGVLPALVQGPLSRFGDTAANTGVLTFLDNIESTKNLPVAAKTVAASAAAAGWRIFLMPVDTVKVRCRLTCVVVVVVVVMCVCVCVFYFFVDTFCFVYDGQWMDDNV
jgi:hypothetical protein